MKQIWDKREQFGNNSLSFAVFNPEIESKLMKVTAFIRKTAKKNDLETKATIYFRLRDGKKDIKAASELSISPNHWSPEKQGYKDRVALVPEDEKIDLNHKVQALTRMIEREYRDDADSGWLGEVIDRFHHPDKYKTEEELAAENPPSFAELFDEFLEKHSLSEVRKKNFRVVKRALMRYELFIRKTRRGMEDFSLDINTVTKDTLGILWRMSTLTPKNILRFTLLFPKSVLHNLEERIRSLIAFRVYVPFLYGAIIKARPSTARLTNFRLKNVFMVHLFI